MDATPAPGGGGRTRETAPGLEIGINRRKGGDHPRVEVTWARAHPGAKADAIRVDMDDVDLRLIRSARVRFCVRLEPGVHSFPLTGPTPFQVEIGPDAVLAGHLEIGPAPGDPGTVILQGGRLELSPPARLTNVVETLIEVRHLFEDRTVADLLKLVGGMSGRRPEPAPPPDSSTRALVPVTPGSGLAAGLAAAWRGLVERLDRRAAEGGLSPGEVQLSTVDFRVRRRGGQGAWEARAAFGGHVCVLDRVTYPFWGVVLPPQILPVLHASLERLASDSPLASGALHVSKVRPMQVARAVRDIFREADADVEVELELPSAGFRTMTADRTRFRGRASLPSGLSLKGRVEARRDGPDIDVSAVGFQAAWAGRAGALTADVVARVNLDLEDGDREPQSRIRADGRVVLRPDSVVPRVDVVADAEHPLAVGGVSARLALSQVALAGTVMAHWDGERGDVAPAADGLCFSANVELPLQTVLRRSAGEVSAALGRGRVAGELRRARPVDGEEAAGVEGWETSFRAGGRLSLSASARVAPVPELAIEDSRLTALLEAAVTAEGRAVVRLGGTGSRRFTVKPDGTVAAVLERAEAALDGRRLLLPEGSRLRAKWRRGEVSSAGLGEVAADVAWDLRGRPCRLVGRGHEVDLLSDDLKEGEVTMHLSPGGRMSFSGDRGGLYGVRFFNALLDPASETEHLVELVQSDEALSRVAEALDLFDPELARLFQSVRRWIARFRDQLKEEGVERPGDAIPRERIACILSRALAGDRHLVDRLVPLVKSVTEGDGLDLRAAKDVVREALGDRRLDYEVDGLLRWLDLVTAPSEAVPRAERVLEMPLVDDPQFSDALRDLPSAWRIYETVGRGSVALEFQRRLGELSPYLTLAQLEHLIGREGADWDPAILARLKRVRAVKRLVARVEEGYGGFAYAAQPAFVAGFLGEAVGHLPGVDDPSEAGLRPACTLGPRDVAVLLQAGLAEGRLGLQAQINNRLLLELIRSRPAEFLREVLVEVGLQVPRILTGVLFAFLHQDQDEMSEPIDLVELLSGRLGLPVPRQADYMAGGRRARESYYEALSELADGIFGQAGPWLARRAWLREVRHAPIPGIRATPDAPRREAEARKAIEAADALASKCEFAGQEGASHRKARQAYRTAFQACAAFLDARPDGFQVPWMKDFWARNEEALKVLSVVRNWQEDVDDVRHWLAVNAGRTVRRDDQGLLKTVIDVLYAYPADRAAVRSDPLVRLMVDPEPGRYDFTVISAMGVVTDGAEGRELEDAYRRLSERRGVRVIRAHTGLFRSLEYNARMIIKAVRDAKTPWGWIGYSQGCANGLLAESFLRGGTPGEQRLLDRLVARNLLFSAANGSVHGTSGSVKFVRAMIEGERFLKHYQASYSRELVSIVLRTMRATMDSRVFVNSLGGTYSLSMERARVLHRDGQFAPWVPTSTTRGMVLPERLPEALEYLYFVHRRLLPGVDCDSQVASEEQVGHATRVRNPWTEVLEQCDIGSRVQATHHWSPLTAEIDFVTTERDRARAVYQGPKDRHVFPWVDVHARFGRIRSVAAGAKPKRKRGE